MKRSIKPKSNYTSYDVTVIIICRNGKKVTQKCLYGISKLKVKQIIVVDNDSNDGTHSFLLHLAKQDKRFRIIRNNENHGFAEANNQGIEIAIGKYVLFLNNDTVIIHDFLPELLESLKRKEVAAVQPMILFPDETIDSIGSFFTPTGFLYHKAHRMKPDLSFLRKEEVYSLKGACMLWKTSVLKTIGSFDESYFAYFEETELCHRAINHGYKVMVNPDSSIIHLGGFTSNEMNQKIIQYFNTKNRFETFIRHLPLLEILKVVVLHVFLTQAIIGKTFFSGRITLAFSMQKALLVGIWNGVIFRINHFSDSRSNLQKVTKYPNLSYYKALFSSLKGYTKIW